ncbi:MAG: hypothetical protein ABJ327_13315 [Litoreibacter sp.]
MKMLVVFLINILVAAMPISAETKVIVCSKFEFFNAATLKNFRKTEEITDWMLGKSLPNDVSRIVLAIPKSAVHEEFGCVEQTERLVPGVRETIINNSSAIGLPPEESDKIVIGKYSGTPLFGPITTKTSYLRANSIVVQITVTSDAEPFRSINAIERYYDLPLGYCEKHANCGVEYGEP